MTHAIDEEPNSPMQNDPLILAWAWCDPLWGPSKPIDREIRKLLFVAPPGQVYGGNLDGRNRAIVMYVGGHIFPQDTEVGPHRLRVRCVAVRITRLMFIRVTFVPHGIAEWLARVR